MPHPRRPRLDAPMNVHHTSLYFVHFNRISVNLGVQIWQGDFVHFNRISVNLGVQIWQGDYYNHQKPIPLE